MLKLAGTVGLALAVANLKRRIRVLAVRGILGAIGGIFVVAAAVFFLVAAHVWMSSHIGAVLSAAIIGGVLLLIGLLLLFLASRPMREQSRAIEQPATQAGYALGESVASLAKAAGAGGSPLKNPVFQASALALIAGIFLGRYRSRRRLRPQKSGLGSGRPSKCAARLASIESPIARRVSTVALPWCGCSTTLSMREQRLGNVRLVDEHVERGAAEPPLLQRRHQRRLVDDRAARHVDQNALRPQRIHHAAVDQLFGGAPARHDDDEDGAVARHAPPGRHSSDTARPASRVARNRRSRSGKPSSFSAITEPIRPMPTMPTCRPAMPWVKGGCPSRAQRPSRT